MVEQLRPMVAAVGGGIDMASAGPEVYAQADVFPCAVLAEGLAVDTLEDMVLGKPRAHCLPGSSSIAGPVDAQVAAFWDPCLVELERDDEEGVGVVRIDGGGEAELAGEAR